MLVSPCEQFLSYLAPRAYTNCKSIGFLSFGISSSESSFMFETYSSEYSKISNCLEKMVRSCMISFNLLILIYKI